MALAAVLVFRCIGHAGTSIKLATRGWVFGEQSTSVSAWGIIIASGTVRADGAAWICRAVTSLFWKAFVIEGVTLARVLRLLGQIDPIDASAGSLVPLSLDTKVSAFSSLSFLPILLDPPLPSPVFTSFYKEKTHPHGVVAPTHPPVASIRGITTHHASIALCQQPRRLHAFFHFEMEFLQYS